VFTLSGDGVHANRQGHWLMARETLRALGAAGAWIDSPHPEELVDRSRGSRDGWALIQRRQRLIKDAALSFVGPQRPGMAAGKPWEQAQSEAREIGFELNR
jgi:hypothetical protein